MSKSRAVRPEDLLYLLFRGGSPDFDLEKTHGQWFIFLNVERGIRTAKNNDHRWLRLRGVKIGDNMGINFDPEVEPLFLRSTRQGEAPEAVYHAAHKHSKMGECALNLDAYVWTRVNRSLEPGIRDYARTIDLDNTKSFCLEKEASFLKSFLYYLTENGLQLDISEAGL